MSVIAVASGWISPPLILLCMRRFEPAQFTADVIHMLLKIFKLSADVIHGDPDIPMEQFYGIESFLQFVPDVHVFLQQIQYAGLAHAVSKGLCRAMFFVLNHQASPPSISYSRTKFT